MSISLKASERFPQLLGCLLVAALLLTGAVPLQGALAVAVMMLLSELSMVYPGKVCDYNCQRPVQPELVEQPTAQLSSVSMLLACVDIPN